jgi:hypothetical protein
MEKYAICVMCGKYHPRGRMLGVNVRFYDERNKLDHVQMRLCKKHWQEFHKNCVQYEWKNELKDEHEIDKNDMASLTNR